MNDWFKDWFSSDYYLTVYSHRNQSDAQKLIDLISKLNIPKNSKVLDAACGAGRHSLLLAGKGFNVTGFDLSRNLLNVAAVNAAARKIDLNLVNADLRDVQFKSYFDLIVNLFTSFGYFESDEENFAFINNSYSFLKNDGYFVFDYFNKEYLVRTLVPETMREEGGLKIKEERSITKNRVVKKITIEDNKRIEYIESVKIYESEKIIDNFISAGYKLFEMYGDYSGNKFNDLNSPRLLLIFEK